VLTQTLIREAQVPFKIVLDTFHHYLYVEDEVNFETKIDISLIGLVHVSGVEDDRRKALLTDEERLMLSERDLMKNIEQVLRLERLGYQGIYSFEPFSSVLAGWSEADIEREIRQSIALLTP
jgi:2-keto-myo-inositol isomerase